MNKEGTNQEGTKTSVEALRDELMGIVTRDADEKTKVKAHGLVLVIVSMLNDGRLELMDPVRFIKVSRFAWTPLYDSQFEARCSRCGVVYPPGSYIWVTSAVDPVTNKPINRYFCKGCMKDTHRFIEPELPFPDTDE